MFLPGGPENLSLRRLPLVSFVLTGLAVFFYLLFLVIPNPSLDPLQAAVSFRTKYPFLRADAELEKLVKIAPLAWLKKPHPRPVEEETEHRLQDELNELSRRGMAAYNHQHLYLFGFIPGRFSAFALVAHLFFHVGLLQLLANFFFFYITGPYLEDRWGRPFFAIFFVAGGVAAALGFALFNPHLLYPLTGSAGAVAAVIGAYMVRYHKVRLRFVDLFGLFGQEEYFVSPLLFFSTWFIAQFLLVVFLPARLFGGQAANPYWVVIFGLCFGLVTALIIKLFNLEPLLYRSDFERLPEEEQWRIRVESSEQLSPEATMRLYGEAWHRFPENDDFLKGYWEQAMRSGLGAEALDAGREIVAREIRASRFAAAWFLWDELSLRFPRERLLPELTMRLVHGLLSLSFHEEASALMDRTLANLPGDLPGEALMLLVETAGFVNPRLGLQAIERALAQPGLSDTNRAELTRLRQETGQLYPEALAAAEPKTISIAADPFVMALTEGDIFTPTRIEKLKLYQGIPLKVTEAGLELQMAEGKRNVLLFERMFAIAAAAVREIGNTPYMLIDLLTDDPLVERAHHGCLRLNGLQFSPAALLAVNEPPAQAMRSLIRLLARHSEATILPDEAALDGERFLSYASVEEFELATYGVTSR